MAVRKKKRAPAKRKTGVGVSLDWSNSLNLSGEAFHKMQRQAQDNLYFEAKASDLHPFLFTWMKKNDYTAEEVKCARAAPNPNVVPCLVAKLLLDGMPDLHPGQADYWESLAGTTGTLKPKTDYLRGYIADAIARGKPFVDAKREEEKAASVEKRVLSIQDRIRIASDAIICDIEEVVDDYIADPAKFKKFDAIKFFRGKQVNQAHCKHIRNYYAPQLAEYTELTLPAREQDEDLREGYAHLSKADVKKGVELFNSIVGACDLIEAESKATRKTRTPKPKSADKLVAKMKYCKTDDKYKVASINPADIIDATEVWVFNTKTRKIGKYVAEDHTTLSVKGTTLQFFNPRQSVAKTLRKPEEQLREFNRAGKVALRKYMDNINAVETQMNGRFNADTVILKAVK